VGAEAIDWSAGAAGMLAFAAMGSLGAAVFETSMDGVVPGGVSRVEAVGGGGAVGVVVAPGARWMLLGAGRSASQSAVAMAASRQRAMSLERTWARPYYDVAPEHGRPLPRALTWSDRNINYRRVEGSA